MPSANKFRRCQCVRSVLIASVAMTSLLLTACGDSKTTIVNGGTTATNEASTAATTTVTSDSTQAPQAPQPADSAGNSSSLVPDSGTYTGQAVQGGQRESTNKTYPMSMSFSSGGSSVDYPTLNCHGTLRPDGFKGSRRLYIEEITRGHCDSGGTWSVLRQAPNQLLADWTLGTQDYGVAVTLTR